MSSTAPFWSRTVPVKVTMAPMSLRPTLSFAISAPMSKSCCWTRITSASGHRREESDLARGPPPPTVTHMALVDGGAGHLLPPEGIGELRPARFKPGDQLGDRGDMLRHRDVFRGAADLLLDPGEIEEAHLSVLLRHEVGDGGAEIIVARVERDDRRDPQES